MGGNRVNKILFLQRDLFNLTGKGFVIIYVILF